MQYRNHKSSFILMLGAAEQKTVQAVSAAFVYRRVLVTQGQIQPQYV